MLTLVRGDLHPMLEIELARRGRVWGECNADALAAMRAGPTYYDPGVRGFHPYLIQVSSDHRFAATIGGYRRFAAPAP